MAIWHLRAQVIGRSKGKSAVGAAAYRSGTSIHSEHADLNFDYSKKRGVAFCEILVPAGAPEWSKDRGSLWNAVERFEKRKDATLAREIEVALPTELTLEQNKELIREYIKDQFIHLGMVADYAIHDLDGKNPHAHIMLTMRPISEKGFGQKNREWNDKNVFETWREQWAAITNKHLAINGHDKKIDHRSYIEQGVDLEPTIHIGNEDKDKTGYSEREKITQEIKNRNYIRILENPQIALDLLTHHESIFSQDELAKFVNSKIKNVEEFTRLKLVIETYTSCIDLGVGIDGKHYYTSQQVLERERDLLESSSILAKSNNHKMDPKYLSFVLADKNLNKEQLSAFEYILSGNDLSLIVGFAGTGKSYLMNAVREAYESKGYRVLGTALSGRASDGLKQSAGIESRTIARNLIDWENGRHNLNEKTVLVIDEIGMVGTRQMQLLINEANRVGAKVIGCGDPEQIAPVEAGCPFRVMLERNHHVFLKNVIRQNIDWQRQATVELSTKQHGKALDRYQDNGHIYEYETRNEAINAIIDKWNLYQQESPEKISMMMAYRNKDVMELSLKARHKLIEQGKLVDKNSITVKTAKFKELDFAINERIMFLQNDNDIDVKNGLMGNIEAINNSVMTVKMDRGDRIAFDTNNYNDIGYGYASTVHKLQGETVDKSFVLATPHFDRFITNVAMDRHRDSVELHYGKDDFVSYENLKRTLSRGESKILAVEFAQARGIDYELANDIAAKVESKTNFNDYWKELLGEAKLIKDTLAEKYLQSIGITDSDCKSLKYHPAVWEKETQSHMPALIAQAIGFDENRKASIKGVKVTFLDKETCQKAKIALPVKYAGESNETIIMVQKPTKPDNRWHIAFDIETAAVIAKADPTIRVACISTMEKLENNPLQGHGNRLTLCVNQDTPIEDIKRAKEVFAKKEYIVFMAKPENAKSFSDLLKKDGMNSVKNNLINAKFIAKTTKENSYDKDVLEVIKTFLALDKELTDAKLKSQHVYVNHAQNKIEEYAVKISEKKDIIQKLQKEVPHIVKRINCVIEAERDEVIEK